MASREEAEEALYKGIASVAEEASRTKSADLLKSAAESFREVAHGPSGGSYEHFRVANDTTHSTSTSTAKSTQNYTGESRSDYHETHHRDGEPRNPPGFRHEE